MIRAYKALEYLRENPPNEEWPTARIVCTVANCPGGCSNLYLSIEFNFILKSKYSFLPFIYRKVLMID